MAKNVEDAKMEEKRKHGKLLYSMIIKNFNSIDEMYDKFVNTFPNFQIYGNTYEKALLNYCTFKSDVVELAFKVRYDNV